MLTYDDLKNLKSSHPIRLRNEKDKFRSHVFYDPHEFSYKFMKCRYENNKRKFSHVGICEFALDDLPEQASEMLKKAIEQLHESNDCWNIELTSNTTYHCKKINCDKCKSLK